jgi:outer membrane protein assembly factor BamB
MHRTMNRWGSWTRHVRRFAAVLISVAAFAITLPPERSDAAEPAADRWSRWRGSDGSGLAGPLLFPRTWTTSDWVWTAALPGTGHASPVIWKDHIYTASADEPAGKRFVTCTSLVDGRQLWNREIPGPIEPHHKQNSSASGSATADATGVYWMWAAKAGVHVEAFAHDGRPLWSVPLGPFAGEHGFAASPAVCGDLLIVPNDQEAGSFIVALETATGKERWRLPRESAKTGYATPLIVGADGGPQQIIIASMAHGLTGIDPVSGKVLWERRCFTRRTVSSPVHVGGLVMGTCGEGGGDNSLIAVRIPGAAAPPAGKPPEPDVAYELDRSMAPYVPTPVSSGDRLYLWGDRGVVTCVDAKTGELRWRGRVGGTFSASPIAIGGGVLNVSADGEIVTLADRDEFEILGRVPLGETCRATPAVAGGRMIFRGESKLYALDAARQ